MYIVIIYNLYYNLLLIYDVYQYDIVFIEIIYCKKYYNVHLYNKFSIINNFS